MDSPRVPSAAVGAHINARAQERIFPMAVAVDARVSGLEAVYVKVAMLACRRVPMPEEPIIHEAVRGTVGRPRTTAFPETFCVRVQSYIVILVENLVRIGTLWFLQTNLDQSCHRQDNVTTLGVRHRHTQLRDERIMTVQEEPSLHMNSTRKMSRMKCGHPGNFLL